MKKEIKMTFGKSINGSIQPNLKESIYLDRCSEKDGLLWFSENLKVSGFSQVFENQKTEIQKELVKLEEDFSDVPIPDSNDYYNLVYNKDYLNDQLFALSEMNIIYNYKQYEITLKRLIKITYKNNNRFYNWDKIIDFFKNKEILISELNGFNQVRELKDLNNHLKHSSREVHKEIKNIPEFKDLDYLNEKVINEFYDRVKSFPHILIEEISKAIYKNLYEFNPAQMKELAKKYALRMEKTDAELFIKEFSKLY